MPRQKAWKPDYGIETTHQVRSLTPSPGQKAWKPDYGIETPVQAGSARLPPSWSEGLEARLRD